MKAIEELNKYALDHYLTNDELADVIKEKAFSMEIGSFKVHAESVRKWRKGQMPRAKMRQVIDSIVGTKGSDWA